jgi:N-acetylglucosamine kinase-like BadF-type ATPase
VKRSLPRYYLGVDGGQSSTTAIIANQDGQVLGVGRSGPCNHVSGDEATEKFLRVMRECLSQATSNARLDLDSSCFAAACLGFSGGAEDKASYSRELIRSDRLKLTDDAEIALIGATEGEPGIVVIAGTGSIAFGRNAQDQTARAGGWGYLFGDEGGAFDIVRRALRAALQFEEGWGPATSLHERMLEHTSAQTVNQLMHRWYAEQSRQAIAELAPLVTMAAEEGDAVAQNILGEAARALSWYAEGVYRSLFREHATISVAHIGGVFKSSSIRVAFAEQIRKRIGRDVIRPKLSPAAGALLEALRMDGNASKLTGVPETKT